MDLAAVQAGNLANRERATAGPALMGLKYLKYCFQNLPDHFIKSVNPLTALQTNKAALLPRLKEEFGQLFKWGGGLFALGTDLAFTTVPGAWQKFRQAENPLVGIRDALGELGKGTIFAGAGMSAAALYAALFPAVGIPGLLMSNIAYEGGKKLVSLLTGMHQEVSAPYLNPGGDVDRFIRAAGTSSAGQPMPATATEASIASPVAPTQTPATASGVAATNGTLPPGVSLQQAYDSLPESSKQNIAAALKATGSSLDKLLQSPHS